MAAGDPGAGRVGHRATARCRVHRTTVVRKLATATASAVFTIPSLALFVMLPVIIPTRVRDEANVIVALTLYQRAMAAPCNPIPSYFSGQAMVFPRRDDVDATLLGLCYDRFVLLIHFTKSRTAQCQTRFHSREPVCASSHGGARLCPACAPIAVKRDPAGDSRASWTPIRTKTWVVTSRGLMYSTALEGLPMSGDAQET